MKNKKSIIILIVLIFTLLLVAYTIGLYTIYIPITQQGAYKNFISKSKDNIKLEIFSKTVNEKKELVVPIVQDTITDKSRIDEFLSVLNTAKVHRVIQSVATLGRFYSVRLKDEVNNTQIEFIINATSITINNVEYAIDSNILQDLYDRVFHKDYPYLS